MCLAPSLNLDSADPMVVGALDVFHDAFLERQIARIPERPFLRSMRPRNGVRIQAAIKVMGRPTHGGS